MPGFCTAIFIPLLANTSKWRKSSLIQPTATENIKRHSNVWAGIVFFCMLMMKKIKYIIRIHEIVQRHINYNFSVDLPQSIQNLSWMCIQYNTHTHVCDVSESQSMKFQLILIAEILSTFSGGIVLLLEGCTQKNFILVRRKISKKYFE